ncbi:hypothetical protein V1514DRAFT_312069 [Lipomyces japonicus]|uniref:uncharacterized protein n=1 Tax=Lipomyces japonicus TaxID=56871 RepID=UPI0034CFDD7F
MPVLLDLPDELLLQIYNCFRGSDFYASVLVNKHLNRLLTKSMYRHLKLHLPKYNTPLVKEEENCLSSENRNINIWENDESLLHLFDEFSVGEDESTETLKVKNFNKNESLLAKKGSGALLKRTFKENFDLARMVKMLTIVGQDLQSEDIIITEDGMAEFASPPDSFYKGVRNLIAHLTNLESLVFQGDSAQLSALISSIPKSISSLSLERLSRLQFGDVFMFRKLQRLTIRSVISSEITQQYVSAPLLSKSVIWETLYTIRMLLEQNSMTLEELVLGNWNFDMLFENYLPYLPNLHIFSVELAESSMRDRVQIDLNFPHVSTILGQFQPDRQRVGWSWLYNFVRCSNSSLCVYLSCIQPHFDETSLYDLIKGIDWKFMNRQEGGKRIKRKSRFRGHALSNVFDWTIGYTAESTALVEFTIKRNRLSNGGYRR